jgi:ferredoxin
MKTLYFTGTGNSLYVAKRIGGELLSIPRLLADKKFDIQDDAVGLVYPCYGLGTPRIVREYLRQSRLKADYFFAVITMGGGAMSALRNMEKEGRAAGITFSYTNEIAMSGNYLPMSDMAAEVAKEPSKGIEKKLDLIRADIAARKKQLVRKNFGSDLLSALMTHLGPRLWMDNADRKFHVDEKCNACGACAKVCPVNNIKLDPKPQYLHHCEGCFGCVNNCPQGAIHHKSEKSGARFRNSHIELAELIAANDMTERTGK